ncbi:MAG TPA: hypothetical protein VFV55_00960 [Usitatibacteraceae bacterium]|nr:hypothetical protein [Usitatibacteraceae bacterium]
MTALARTAPDQERYARVLAIGTNAGLAMLVILFGIYVLGVVDPHVPHERLPDLWHLSAGNLLEHSGVEAGWGWTAIIHRADTLTLVGIVTLAICSVPCLLAVMPIYWASGQRTLCAICALEVAVIVLAASGVVGGGH